MALNVKDGAGASVSLKTSLDGADHVPHHNVDNIPTDYAKESGGNLAAILAKIIAAPSTEAKQDVLISLIAEIIKNEDSSHVNGDKGVMMLGVRNDSEVGISSPDGNYSPLQVNEYGRLKVSAQPGIYSDVTGSITAVQANINTPVAGGTIEADVTRASNVMMFCQGTFSAINCSFEGNLEDSGDTGWFTIQAVRSNANTIETATGNLSATPSYAWELSVNALARVRVRCTARTSGTQNWRFRLGSYATEPIPASQVTATQPVSGTVTVVSTRITPNAADGHSSTHHSISAATTNSTSVKGSAASVGVIELSNNSATACYFKLFNSATAPVVGSSTPVMTKLLPPNTSLSITGNSPIRLSAGLGYSITRNVAVADTTSIGANEVTVSIFYT